MQATISAILIGATNAADSEPDIVPTLQAAYALLDLTDPDFEPVEHA